MKKEQLNKAIIYDDNCPLCKAYTNAFVKAGFIENKYRIPFSKIINNEVPGCSNSSFINWNKARNQIPLIDVKTGEVKYGIDALVEVLQQKISFVKPVMQVAAVRWFFLKLYKLISYNRTIIVATNKPVIGAINSSPDYSFAWRCMLILTTFFLSAFFINTANKLLQNSLQIQLGIFVNFGLLFISLFACIGQSKTVITEIIAHAGITTLISTFLWMMISFIKKYFALSDSIFVMLTAVFICIIAMQFIRRRRFILNSLNC